ncbi:MAG: hypothetical protein ABSG76_24680 [Xanthobacteraceae bacterium]|jgi:hypothetical protein
MPLRYEKDTVHFEDHCTVEEALGLVEFFAGSKAVTVVLRDCASLHTALVQVLAAAGPERVVPPADEILRRIIMPFLVAAGVAVSTTPATTPASAAA